jgi:DNA-directed RNA polymerase beta' subunit
MADFDGDQMNLWIARGAAARAEALIQSPIANWFISTKSSSPLNGQVQDSVIGCYELTRSAVRIDKYHAMGLFTIAGVEPPRFDRQPPGHLYTGRDIASLLLARTPVDYRRAPTSYSDVYAPFIDYDPEETLTVIEQGVLVKGVLDKAAIGAGAGGVFHLISREYGSQRALDVLYTMQQIALQFLLWRGFTVGPADLLPDAAALREIRALVSGVLLESKTITDRLLRGEIVPPIDTTVHDFYEQLQVEGALKIPDTEILRWILGSINPSTNGFFRMIATGAKGSNPNFIHVSGAIGQTTIDGERITERFAFRRTLPYYARFSVEPAAYGFVANGYMVGMRTDEFICQDMNGRFDLINKALTTATTGYFMRKGVMNNQSSIVDNYRRVTKDTKVVQFVHGEDGCDARELEKVVLRTVPLGDAALKAAVWVDVAALTGETGAAAADAQAAVDEALAKIAEDRDAYRRIFIGLETANFGQPAGGGGPVDPKDISMLLPVNIGRVVEGVFIAAKGAPPPPLTAAGLAGRVRRVWDLCARLPYTLLNEIQERRRTPVAAHKLAATSMMCMLARTELCPAVLARLSDEQLTYIIDAVRQRYSLSLIDYGTAAGVLAAQAISQPLTQYMLDSHHRSVGGGTSKSGLIRVSEIYGACAVAAEQSSAMQLPLVEAALGPPEGALAAAQAIANGIEYVTLRRFTSRHDTLLEPYRGLIYPAYAGDAAWIAAFERSHPLMPPPGDLTNWCFRFVLDKSALVLKAVELELIVQRLRRRHPGIYVVHTPEAVPEIVIRIWHRAAQFKRSTDEDRLAELLREALDTPVRGIRGIMSAKAERVGRTRVAADGSLVRDARYVIKTHGTNLYSACLNAAVDARAVVSNSIGDTYKLLGVEAARAKIVSETKSFMEGRAPNMRHLYMYACEMTRTGRVTSIERGGLGIREHNNVLLRMAYGAPIGVVTDATFASMKSHVYGIAAPLLLGAIPQIGSLYNELVVDEDFVNANTVSVDNVLDSL